VLEVVRVDLVRRELRAVAHALARLGQSPLCHQDGPATAAPPPPQRRLNADAASLTTPSGRQPSDPIGRSSGGSHEGA
jgi:hypothetical protein